MKFQETLSFGQIEVLYLQLVHFIKKRGSGKLFLTVYKI